MPNEQLLDAVLQVLVANQHSTELVDRMTKRIKQSVFVRVAKGRYRLVQLLLQFLW
ncbi:MAG: hypothetical protein ACFFDE_09880 [Promethearchaeota archaeon]